jgi:flagellin
MSDGTSTGISSAAVNINQLSATQLGLGASATATISGSTNASVGDTFVVGQTTYTIAAAATVSAAAAATQTTSAGSTTAKVTAGVEVTQGATMAATLANLAAAINGTGQAGTQYQTGAIANLDATASSVTSTGLTITADTSGAGAAVAAGVSDASGNHIAASGTDLGGLGFSGNTGSVLNGGSGLALDLSNSTDAAAALTAITTAINSVASQRGVIGAAVNKLTAATNVMNAQVTNLTSAMSGISDADIGTTVANMSKYNTLSQTGISALQQANQASQSILKLLQ